MASGNPVLRYCPGAGLAEGGKADGTARISPGFRPHAGGAEVDLVRSRHVQHALSESLPSTLETELSEAILEQLFSVSLGPSVLHMSLAFAPTLLSWETVLWVTSLVHVRGRVGKVVIWSSRSFQL